MEIMEKRPMDIWFTEYSTPNLRLGLRITEILRNSKTPYQELLVAQTKQEGRMLALDGAIQLTEKDEFTYHEMMAHILLCSHPAPRQVLVVGGGDGGIVREVVRHEIVERVVLCEIDEEVIQASREFFPTVSCALDHPKVQIKPMDALVFIKENSNAFDIIIVDSTDPVDFAVGLFGEPFFRDVFTALRPDGMMIIQTESPFVEPILVGDSRRAMAKVFQKSAVCWGAMPTYPTGMWTYTIGSKSYDTHRPLRNAPEGVRYYSSALHEAAFVLPPFLQKMVEIEE